VPLPSDSAADLEKAIDRFADRHRAACLWFLREDYYPATDEERLRVLGYIQQHGDMAAFREAAELKGCLLRITAHHSPSKGEDA
jgi:hypothetical protein